MEPLLKIQLKLLTSTATAPQFATNGSAGIDLSADIQSNIELKANDCVLIPTGIAIHINNNNYCGLIYPRSGLGHKNGIILGNSVGVIDSDYTGEIFVSLFNRSNKTFVIEPKMRIAQMVFSKITKPKFELVNDFENTQRNAGGFGSTGV